MPPGGGGALYLEGRFNGGFFCVTSSGGLYLEEVINGGAYFWNFTVFVTLAIVIFKAPYVHERTHCHSGFTAKSYDRRRKGILIR